MADIDNNCYIPLAGECGELSTIDAYKCAGDFLGECLVNVHGHTGKCIFPIPIAFLYKRYVELKLGELIENVSGHPYGNASLHHHELNGDCADEFMNGLWDELVTFSAGLRHENLTSGGLNTICAIHRYLSLLIRESHSMEIEISDMQKLSKTSPRIKECEQSSTIDVCKCAGDVLVESITKDQLGYDKTIFISPALFLYNHYIKFRVNKLSAAISFQPYGSAHIFHNPQDHHELNGVDIDEMWAKFIKMSEGIWPDNQPPELLDKIGTLIHYISLLASEPNLNALDLSDVQKLIKTSTIYVALIATAFDEISVHTIFDSYADDLWDEDVNHAEVESLKKYLKELNAKKCILEDDFFDLESEVSQMRFDSHADDLCGKDENHCKVEFLEDELLGLENELRELGVKKCILRDEICDIESEIKSLIVDA